MKTSDIAALIHASYPNPEIPEDATGEEAPCSASPEDSPDKHKVFCRRLQERYEGGANQARRGRRLVRNDCHTEEERAAWGLGFNSERDAVLREREVRRREDTVLGPTEEDEGEQGMSQEINMAFAERISTRERRWVTVTAQATFRANKLVYRGEPKTFVLHDIQVGKNSQFASGPVTIPMEMFDEKDPPQIAFETCQVGMWIRLLVENVSWKDAGFSCLAVGETR